MCTYLCVDHLGIINEEKYSNSQVNDAMATLDTSTLVGYFVVCIMFPKKSFIIIIFTDSWETS